MSKIQVNDVLSEIELMNHNALEKEFVSKSGKYVLFGNSDYSYSAVRLNDGKYRIHVVSEKRKI